MFHVRGAVYFPSAEVMLEGQGLLTCQSQVIRVNGSACLRMGVRELCEGFCSPAWALHVSRQLEKSSALKKVFIPAELMPLSAPTR